MTAKRNLGFRGEVPHPVASWCACGENGLRIAHFRRNSLHPGRLGQSIAQDNPGRIAATITIGESRQSLNVHPNRPYP